ncbi:MAG: hypothetical protein ACRDQ0_17185 [Pseudonocardia sp.]
MTGTLAAAHVEVPTFAARQVRLVRCAERPTPSGALAADLP